MAVSRVSSQEPVGFKMPVWFFLLLPLTVSANHPQNDGHQDHLAPKKVRRPLHIGQMERVGRMTDRELAEIEDLLNTVEDDGDMVHLVVPPPPFTSMGHRAPTLMCQVGDRVYCPGEVLFSLGDRFTKTEVCTSMGHFITKRVLSKFYREPKRCQFQGVEYCNGEVIRGFLSWHFVQQCRNGHLHLEAAGKRDFKTMMKRFHLDDNSTM